jgi:nucleoside-diphosphate-sugar epimerase
LIALERAGLRSGGPPTVQWVLIFGVGLIGETLVAELSRRGFTQAARLSFSWRPELTIREYEADAICGWVRARVNVHVHSGIPADRVSLDIVWSAGRGGFASSWESLDLELFAFQAVTALSSRLLEMLPLAAHRFHLTSSAGGLYEGQLNVGPEAGPSPLRPYGQLKLEQEQQLRAVAGPLVKHVYRPSSVYGFVSLKSRLGLIATLINNGLRGHVTNIFAEALTLRDYVLVDDIATFMAQKIEVQAAAADCTYVLASAKPTSVHEVLVVLERVLDRSLYFVFRPTKDNTASNTYSAHVLAEGFHPQDLEAGMRSVLLGMRHHFLTHRI